MNQATSTSYIPHEKQIGFQITTHCNLNCKLCMVLKPLYKEKHLCRHIPAEQVKQEINAIFQLYAFVEEVTVSGGEPLLHPELLEIVSYFMLFKEQFHSLRIFTNGTIVPSQPLIDYIEESGGGRLQFVIDDYGPQLSKQADAIEKLCENRCIPCRRNIYHGTEQHGGGWVSCGSPFVYRDYPPEKLASVFLHCHAAQYKCLTVYDGKLGNCAWSVFGHAAGILPVQDGETDCVDLLDSSVPLEEKRKRIALFGKRPLAACQYCDGFDPENSKRYPAAEQV